jgi:hypothetical protein
MFQTTNQEWYDRELIRIELRDIHQVLYHHKDASNIDDQGILQFHQQNRNGYGTHDNNQKKPFSTIDNLKQWGLHLRGKAVKLH